MNFWCLKVPRAGDFSREIGLKIGDQSFERVKVFQVELIRGQSRRKLFVKAKPAGTLHDGSFFLQTNFGKGDPGLCNPHDHLSLFKMLVIDPDLMQVETGFYEEFSWNPFHCEGSSAQCVEREPFIKEIYHLCHGSLADPGSDVELGCGGIRKVDLTGKLIAGRG